MSDNKTIMIVDDSKVSRMMIISFLKDIKPDLMILEATNGLEAIEKSKDQLIDYFSVDYNMPVMDGIEMITKMKVIFKNAKYALLTANVQDATHKKALQLNAKCINKPINEASIAAMLEYFYG